MPPKKKSNNIKEQQDILHSIQKDNIDIDNRIIYVVSDTTQEQAVQFEKNLKFLSDLDKKKPISIIIISDGGDWYAGQSMYDAVIACESPIITIATGSVASAATIVFLAGDTRLVSPHTTFLVHDVTHSSEAKATDVEAELKAVKRQGHVMWGLYAERTNKTKAFWKKKCVGEFYFSAAEAVKIGFAHKVMEP